jgi:hypothetical protein
MSRNPVDFALSVCGNQAVATQSVNSAQRILSQPLDTGAANQPEVTPESNEKENVERTMLQVLTPARTTANDRPVTLAGF